MLKPRIIALLPMRENLVVQSIGFSRHLPVCRPEIAVAFLDQWGIDEIVLLDILATPRGLSLDPDVVARCAEVCHVPLTAGGGIGSVDQVERIIHAGADKVALNAQALARPGLLAEVAERFGRQCVVASVDAVRSGGDAWTVRGDGAGLTPWDAARQAEDHGAGEILLQCVERDGARQGFDLDLAERVKKAVTIPVILASGAGHPDHLREAILSGVSAVAAGNMWHYAEMSVILAKRFLLDAGVQVRLDTYAQLRDAAFERDGRLSKRPDEVLDLLRFEHIPQEII